MAMCWLAGGRVISRTVAALGVATWALAILLGQQCCWAQDSSMLAAIERATDRLTRKQEDEGASAGAWPGEELYTGSIAAGLTRAYELVRDEDSRAAAVAAGEYVMIASAGNYYGDEAYALSCLSRTTANCDEDRWRSALEAFYENVATLAAGSTAGYISQFELAELSQAVFYLSHHAVAAFYVDANDKDLWRQGLVDFLVQVDDDSADLPVLALGAATWSLATIGTLDDSLLDPCGVGTAYWQGRTFAELPGLLVDHQIPEGDLAGSFYWRFDHGNLGTGAPTAGYVEETVFGAMGLAAANRTMRIPEMRDRILLVRDLLIASVDDDGVVTQHLSLGGGAQYFYAAEVLRALGELTDIANLDLRGVVDGLDLAMWAGHWRADDCQDCLVCNRADLDRSGHVDIRDLALLANNWLEP